MSNDVWEMRQRHTFEMAYLIEKQKERRSKAMANRDPIPDIKLPDQLFHKVGINQLSSNDLVKVYIDDCEVNHLTELNIQLLPARPPKVSYVQQKIVNFPEFDMAIPETEIVNGKRQLVTQNVEMLASSLSIEI